MDFIACSVFSVREGLCNYVRVGRDVQEESLCSCLLKTEPSGATSVPLILLEASLNLLSFLLIPFRGDYFKPRYLNLWFIRCRSTCFCFSGGFNKLVSPMGLEIAHILAVSHWLPCVLMKMRLKALSLGVWTLKGVMGLWCEYRESDLDICPT